MDRIKTASIWIGASICVPVSRVVTALHLGLGEFSRVEDTKRERERERERSVEREKDERRWKGDGEIRGRRRGKGTARSHTQRCVQSVTRVLRGDPICKVLPTRRRRIVSLDSVFPPTPPFYTCIYIYIYKEAPILFHFLFFSIFFFPALFNVAPT